MAQANPFEIAQQDREFGGSNIDQAHLAYARYVEAMADAISAWTKAPLDVMTSWFRGVQGLTSGFSAKHDEDPSSQESQEVDDTESQEVDDTESQEVDDTESQEVDDTEKPTNGLEHDQGIWVEPEDASPERPIESPESFNQRLARLRTLLPSLRKVFLLICLAGLSWFATYTGMLELIRANSGDIPFAHQVAIGFAVATLMLTVLYILDALFSPITWWLRTLYIFGYLFLTLISIGFSFGFFWKLLESRGEATRSAEAAIGEVQRALEEGKTRIGQLGSTLDTLTALSKQKEEEELTSGDTCPNSLPGSGPRMRMREADAENFGFISHSIKSRASGIQTDLDSLKADLAMVLSRDPATFDPVTGTRNAFLRGLDRKLDLTLTRFNALRTDPQLAEQRNLLAGRAERTQFDDGKGGSFACPDPQLQMALHGVVRALDSLPSIEKPKIAAVEGSEAIVEAFRRLTSTAIGVIRLKLPPSPEELSDLQRQPSTSAERSPDRQALPPREPGLSSRDYIPLFVAVFVDFCLLLVCINRPINRLHTALQGEEQDRPAVQLLAKFNQTHLGDLQEGLQVFQHAVFDFLGDDYVAIPINTEAFYLANLFTGLEGRGVVDRVLLPPALIVRRKLRLQGSAFAEEPAFRVYKFRSRAWSKLVLDTILTSRIAPANTAREPQGSALSAPFWASALEAQLERPALPSPSKAANGRPSAGQRLAHSQS
jgi:hypothetical protein